MSPRVAVASRSFSKHPVLRAELATRWPDARLNEAGVSLKEEGLAAFLSGCERAILALERVDDALLARVPELKVISKFGVGLDSFDLPAMARRGVSLAWTPGLNARSVAELALMMTLALLRRLPQAQADLRAGTWRQPKGATLTGRVVGLVGFGAVAREFAALLSSFSAHILAYDTAPNRAAAAALNVQLISLEELLAVSDIISIHVPLLPVTRGLIGAERLACVRPHALLINTARGGLVDEGALLAALDAGRLAGAGLDCFAEEPPKDRRLLEHPKILATPHVGGSTEEAILAMGRAAIAGLDTARPAAEFLPR